MNEILIFLGIVGVFVFLGYVFSRIGGARLTANDSPMKDPDDDYPTITDCRPMTAAYRRSQARDAKSNEAELK